MDTNDAQRQLHPEHDPEQEAFEAELRTMLQRLPAPDGFAERVFAHVPQTAVQPGTQPAARTRRGMLLRFTRPSQQAHARPLLRFAYAAAALLAITAGSAEVYHHHQQRRAEEAAAQFDTALAVTNHALDHALNHAAAQLERTDFGQIERALNQNKGGKQ